MSSNQAQALFRRIVGLGVLGALIVAAASQGALASEVRQGALGFSVMSVVVGEPIYAAMSMESRATVTVVVSNHGSTPQVIDSVPGRSRLVNEYGYTWSDVAGGSYVTGTVGAGVITPQSRTIVDAGGQVLLTFPLVYMGAQPGQTAGSVYKFTMAVVAGEFIDGSPPPAVRTYSVSFAGLQRSLPAPETQVREVTNGAGAYPSAGVTDGDLTFRVTSLRVPSSQIPVYLVSAPAKIFMRVFNHGSAPVSLAYVLRKTNFVNEYNYVWTDLGNAGLRSIIENTLTGLPAEYNNTSAPYSIVDPGQSIDFALPLSGGPHSSGQTAGTTFDFAAEFDSYEDLGEGRARKARTYPIAFVGLHRTDDAASAGSAQLPRTVTVGDVHFELQGFEVEPGRYRGEYRAHMRIAITNGGKSPLALNYGFRQAQFIDDRGYPWAEEPGAWPQGMPYTIDGGGPHLNDPIGPQQTRDVDLTFVLEMRALGLPQDTGPGQVFDFAGEFSSWVNLGEGKAREVRCYPIAFLELRSVPGMLGGTSAAVDTYSGHPQPGNNPVGRFFHSLNSAVKAGVQQFKAGQQSQNAGSGGSPP